MRRNAFRTLSLVFLLAGSTCESGRESFSEKFPILNEEFQYMSENHSCIFQNSKISYEKGVVGRYQVAFDHGGEPNIRVPNRKTSYYLILKDPPIINGERQYRIHTYNVYDNFAENILQKDIEGWLVTGTKSCYEFGRKFEENYENVFFLTRTGIDIEKWDGGLSE